MAKDNQLARMSVALVDRREQISRTALNKLLFFADIVHLINHGEPISRVTYRKFDYGPVPDPMDDTRRWMLDSELLEERLGMAGPYVQYIYRINLDDDDVHKVREALTETQLEALDAVANTLGGMSATELSELSHRFEPWKSGDWYKPLNLELARNDPNFQHFLRQRHLIS